MDERLALLDINTATRSELKNLPGVGSALADKLIAARPFSTMDDLTRVQGMKLDLVELLREYAVVVPSNDMEPRSTELVTPQLEVSEKLPTSEVPPLLHPEAAEVEAEVAPPVGIIPVNDELPAAPSIDSKFDTPVESMPLSPSQPVSEPQSAASQILPPPSGELPTPVSRSQLVGAVTGGMIFSSLLSIILVLVFLAALNGGLRYSSQADLRQTSADLSSLSSQLDGLQSDLNSIDQRIAGVEGLGARITHVEGDFDQLRTDIQAAQAEVQSMTRQVKDLGLQVDALVTRTGRFQEFLDGLSGLLENLTQPVKP